MKLVTAAVTALAAVAFVVLLWKLDMTSVGDLVLAAGWGIAFILAQESVAHLLNALGWKLAFDPRRARDVSLGTLLQLRVAGDAINYLTPTATLGGEVSRAVMLRRRHGHGVEAASVAVAKAAQTLGQALFVVAGVALVAHPYLRPSGVPAPVLVAAILGLGLAVVLVAPRVRARLAAVVPVHATLGHVRDFLARHRSRFLLSTALFVAAYAWGAVEAYWICRCLGLRLSGQTVLAIETMSAGLDGLLFMVPAKIGTQEGGKTAIFAALGLAPGMGFAFGVLRHVRELVWAAAGLLVCAVWWHGLRRGGAAARSAGVTEERS